MISRLRVVAVVVAFAAGFGVPVHGGQHTVHAGDVTAQRSYDAQWLPDNVGKAWKITYRTTDARGTVTPSTGLVLVPKGAAPRGGWPVMSWAHGTQGIADRCAYSISGPYQPERDGAYLGAWVEQGYAVVASDYAGLGTPGEHAYLNVRAVQHNIVDMVAAAHQVWDNRRPVPLSSKWVSIGHSQGAGAAVAAAAVATQLQRPGLDFRGAVGDGTPAYVERDLLPLGAVDLVTPAATNAYVAYMLAGLTNIYPEVQTVLSDTGRQWVAAARSTCLGALTQEMDGVRLKTLFDAPLATVPGIQDKLAAYMAMPEQGFSKPVFLAHGTKDVDVSYPNAQAYAAALRANGQPVKFVSYDTNHSDTMTASLPDTTAFVAALIAP